jgi:5'-nucleotidase
MPEQRNGAVLEIIHIYHINDLHSHFENWPRIHSFLKERKTWHQDAGDEVFVFDIGDHVDRSHPFSDGTMGKGNTKLLNELDVTAITIGNNEGITFPFKALDNMYENASFSVLIANLYYQDGSRPEWVKPTMIQTTKGGTRIGIIGLTVFYQSFYHQLGWKLTDPLEELRKQVEKLKNQTDFIILLSHLGINEDEAIARDFPEIDVILGAHTHHVFHEGKVINNAMLCAAGKYGQFVGHAILELEANKIIKKKALLYDTNELPPIEDEKETNARYFAVGKHLLKDKVVELPEDIKTDPFRHSPLPALLCEALHEWCEADCAFLNAGLLLNGLSKGTVTRYDLLEICPHPINPCLIQLTGSELKEVLQQTLEDRWPHLQIRGFGFRGAVMGTFIYSGIIINHSTKETQILIGNEKIDPAKIYKVAIPDMFSFGRFFPAIFRAENKKYFLPEFMRNLLEWKLMKINPINK